jgi:23S rRNA pseudouridine1911/1915/1917 synthase
MAELTDLSRNYIANRASVIELTVPAECAGLRLDQALTRLLPDYSRSRLQDWVRTQHVTLDGEAATPRQKVWGGERVRLAAQADIDSGLVTAEDIPLDIVHMDDTILVINKPAGLVVHPGAGNIRGTLQNALLGRCPDLAGVPRAGIVHRLDKDTSGLLVVARTLTAHTSLVRQLQARSVTRRYLALAHGIITAGGTIEQPIGRHPVQRTRMAVNAGGKPARTYFRVLERFGHATLLECKLDTGRTHQIRVHLKSIGHPLVGDAVYRGKIHTGPAMLREFPRQALHAYELALLHPVTSTNLSWRAELPADFAGLLQQLRADIDVSA